MDTTRAIYAYKAELVRVVDGDSVILDISLGFCMWLRGERCRLAGIDAPETWRVENPADGEAAKLWLANRLDEIEQLYIRTFKSPDKYGRWLVELYSDLDGQSINDEMVELGFARKYE